MRLFSKVPRATNHVTPPTALSFTGHTVQRTTASSVMAERKVFPARFFRSSSLKRARFEAWAYPTKLVKWADHTYVVCTTEDKKWGCHGGTSGGKRITEGDGKFNIAKCIANKGPVKEEAGIIYGLNGVCHQIANRILWPTRKTVIKAHGSRATIPIYGHYGNDPAVWAAIMGVCEISNRLPRWLRGRRLKLTSYPEIDFTVTADMVGNAADSDDFLFDFKDENHATYMSSLMLLYTQQNMIKIEPVKLLGADLEITLRYLLQWNISDKQIEEIIIQQRTLIATSQTHQVNVEKSDTQAMHQVSQVIQESFEKFAKILGDSNYADVFQIPPDQVKYVINPKYELLKNSDCNNSPTNTLAPK